MTECISNFRWGFIRNGKNLIGTMTSDSKRTMECDEVEQRADKWRDFFPDSVITIERVVPKDKGWCRVDKHIP